MDQYNVHIIEGMGLGIYLPHWALFKVIWHRAWSRIGSDLKEWLHIHFKVMKTEKQIQPARMMMIRLKEILSWKEYKVRSHYQTATIRHHVQVRLIQSPSPPAQHINISSERGRLLHKIRAWGRNSMVSNGGDCALKVGDYSSHYNCINIHPYNRIDSRTIMNYHFNPQKQVIA